MSGLGGYNRLEMLGILLSRFIYRKDWKAMMESERRQVLDHIEAQWKKVYAR